MAETTYEIRSPDAMYRLGEKIASSLSGGAVVLLTGELGAGKTVFCKGMAKGLGMNAEVSSPTFTIMNEYVGESIVFRHIDAYRLSSAEEAYASGICEYIADQDSVCAVEWWENIADAFDGIDAITVNIEKCAEENARKVTVVK